MATSTNEIANIPGLAANGIVVVGSDSTTLSGVVGTANGQSLVWNGTAWMLSNSNVGPTGPTGPTGPGYNGTTLTNGILTLIGINGNSNATVGNVLGPVGPTGPGVSIPGLTSDGSNGIQLTGGVTFNTTGNVWSIKPKSGGTLGLDFICNGVTVFTIVP